MACRERELLESDVKQAIKRWMELWIRQPRQFGTLIHTTNEFFGPRFSGRGHKRGGGMACIGAFQVRQRCWSVCDPRNHSQ